MKKGLVEVYRNEILCDSRVIAEKFGKQHKNVLQKIDRLKRDLGNLTAEFSAAKKIKFPLLFEEKTYSARGQVYKYVKMNKPAYTLLVMGFSGKKALQTRLAFNDAFYQMEQSLLRQDNLEWKREREQGKQIRIELTDEIKSFIDYAILQGSKHAIKYYTTLTKMQYKALGLIEKNEKVDKQFRNTLDVMDLHNLISAEQVARKALTVGMERDLHYKDIYQYAKKSVLQLADVLLLKLPELN